MGAAPAGRSWVRRGSGGLTSEAARKACLLVILRPIRLNQQGHAAVVTHGVKLGFAHGGVGVNVLLPEREAAGLFVVGKAGHWPVGWW